jgi:3-deoxy-7-phosphoheptulonate synthase
MIVANSIGNQIATGNEDIVGIMIESNLVQGNQAISADKSTLVYGQSVTDACLGWDATLILLEQISREAEKRRFNARP